MRGPISLIVLAAVAGCGAPLPGTGGGGSDTCNARAQQSLVGGPVTDFAALTAAAPKVRLIFPGDVVTQDQRDDRLNVVFDDQDRVTRVYCG